MKTYVVRDLNDSSKWKLETRSHIAPNCIAEAIVDPETGEFEDPSYLRVETIIDDDGNFESNLIVDETKKYIFKKEKADKIKKDEEDAEAAKFKLAKAKVNIQDKKDLIDDMDLEQVKELLKDILELI